MLNFTADQISFCFKHSDQEWSKEGYNNIRQIISPWDNMKYIIKFTSYEVALEHQDHTVLFRLAGLPIVSCQALRKPPDFPDFSEEFKEEEGIVVMPFIEGEDLEDYHQRQIKNGLKPDYSSLKKTTIAPCIIANYSDPYSDNIMCVTKGSGVSQIFIDAQMGLINHEVAVSEMHQNFMQKSKYVPHYKKVTDSEQFAISENAVQITNRLEKVEKSNFDKGLRPFIDKMIYRGYELIDLI